MSKRQEKPSGRPSGPSRSSVPLTEPVNYPEFSLGSKGIGSPTDLDRELSKAEGPSYAASCSLPLRRAFGH